MAVSPSGVGKILGMMITDHGAAGTRPKVETNPSGPILDGVVLVAAACSHGSSGPRVAGVGSSTPTAQCAHASCCSGRSRARCC